MIAGGLLPQDQQSWWYCINTHNLAQEMEENTFRRNIFIQSALQGSHLQLQTWKMPWHHNLMFWTHSTWQVTNICECLKTIGLSRRSSDASTFENELPLCLSSVLKLLQSHTYGNSTCLTFSTSQTTFLQRHTFPHLFAPSVHSPCQKISN